MKRALLGVVVAVAVLAVWLVVQGGGDKGKASGASERSSKVDLKSVKPRGDTPSARTAPSPWTIDVDPEGPLQLEGQVVDADGNGVGDAIVAVSSVPPRTVKT